MTDATISFLLDNVKQLLAQKLDVISNAVSELEQGQKDIESMKSFLEDYADKKSEEENEKEAKTAVYRLRRREPQIDKTIVGFEDAIDELMGNLKENGTQVEAISIIGMPGSGKTTVASKIYSDPKIGFEFPTRIWINVSEKYNAKDIYLTILKKFTDQDVSSLSETDLALKVRAYLNQVKFLLVVDDVWTVEAWKDIKLALPIEGTGKVLVTTRYEQVANAANPMRLPHKLPFLTPEESWKLLQFEVYGKEGVWPSDLVEIGQLSANKCNGLPRALVVVGGILKDWTKVSKGVE